MKAFLTALKAWFGPAPQSARVETYEQKVMRVGRLASKAIPAYAAMIEISPLVISPESRLPLSKDEMKLALKLAWMTYKDAQQQNFVMQAYGHLSQFRDDVALPIDPTLSTATDSTPAETLKILEPYLAVSARVTAEMEILLLEFEEFARGEAIRHK